MISRVLRRPQAETPLEAIQAFADDTQGDVVPTKEYRRSRRRSLIGAAALTLVVGGTYGQLFDGSSNDSHDGSHSIAGGDKTSSAPAPSRSPERQALTCKLDSVTGLSENASGMVVNLPVKASGGHANAISYVAVPYANGDFGKPLPRDTTDSTPGFNVDVSKDQYGKSIGVYAIAGSETAICGAVDVASADHNVHFSDEELPPTYQP